MASAWLQVIKKHTNSHQRYVEKLVEEGSMTADEVATVHNRIQSLLQVRLPAENPPCLL